MHYKPFFVLRCQIKARGSKSLDRLKSIEAWCNYCNAVVHGQMDRTLSTWMHT